MNSVLCGMALPSEKKEGRLIDAGNRGKFDGCLSRFFGELSSSGSVVLKKHSDNEV